MALQLPTVSIFVPGTILCARRWKMMEVDSVRVVPLPIQQRFRSHHQQAIKKFAHSIVLSSIQKQNN